MPGIFCHLHKRWISPVWSPRRGRNSNILHTPTGSQQVHMCRCMRPSDGGRRPTPAPTEISPCRTRDISTRAGYRCHRRRCTGRRSTRDAPPHLDPTASSTVRPRVPSRGLLARLPYVGCHGRASFREISTRARTTTRRKTRG
jgi:hypothetical protein